MLSMSSSTDPQRAPVPLIEIEGGRPIQAVAFLAPGGYLVGGDNGSVRRWRLADGELVETTATGNVHSIATSSNGRWIASGTIGGEVTVWNARTCNQVFTFKDAHTITALDFSPDSTRLVIASAIGTASILEVPAAKRVVGPLRHQTSVTAAKFSPQGDRIAVATLESIPVYDSRDGSSLFDIRVKVRTYYNTGLAWSDDGQSLFVSSDSKIKHVRVSTTPEPLEWPVPDSGAFPCVALPKHGKFIAYSANRTVTLWDTSTRTQVGQVIQHDQDVSSIAISPDDRFLATVMMNGQITIISIRDILPQILFVGPFIHIGDAALDSWDQDQFAKAEALLMVELASSKDPSHYSLANRALVRARQQQWNAALADADQSIQIRPSVLGFIARSVALVGGGERHGYQACDLAFKYCHPHYDDLLLIKAVIVCMAGEYDDAISCIARLIPTVDNKSKSICHLVQAYMYFLLGNLQMKSKDYENAIYSFEFAQVRMQGPASPYVLPISLITGWKFDDLRTTIQQSLCEALFAVGRAKDAEESFLRLVNSFSNNIYMSNATTEWVSDFMQQLLATGDGNADSVSEHAETTRTGLLTEWVKAKLMNGLWEGALSEAINFNVPRFMVYQTICERLEKDDRLAEATDCLGRALSDLKRKIDVHLEQVKWVNELKDRCSSLLKHLGDAICECLGNVDRSRETGGHEKRMKWVNEFEARCSSLLKHLGYAKHFGEVIFERVENNDRLPETTDSLPCTASDLKRKIDAHKEQVKWVDEFKERCSSLLKHFGEVICERVENNDRLPETTDSLPRTASNLKRKIDAHKEQVKWVNEFEAFCSAGSLLKHFEEVICERLENNDRLPETTDSLHRTASDLKRKIDAHKEQVKWVNEFEAFCSSLLKHLGDAIFPQRHDRLAEVTRCLHRSTNDLEREIVVHERQVNWVNEFMNHCTGKLEDLGDAAVHDKQFKQAIAHYSALLSLDLASPHILTKRSKVFVEIGLWEEALVDANKVITCDPSSPWGYKMMHAALHCGERYDEAVDALKIMHSKIFQSPDSKVHEALRQYVNPLETTSVIRKAVRDTIRDSPRVLINTISGLLLDKSQQALTFESLPAFKELVSSMTTRIDRSRIDQEVIQYYQYAMLSHTWEEHEPLFQEVAHTVIYDLEQSPTHDKLQMFCKIVRDAGLHWAWSDTCCINKQDHVVLQEALVAMFKWYHNSAVTIVHLHGVRSAGGLVRSLWNSRAWTLQEYLAAKVIQFYTEDWTPYANLGIPNHKESPDIISEMAEAACISARELKALRPGLDDIRVKLCLASRREATRFEDAAYSLFGIFSMAMPVIYGEGDKALGRLLGHLLAGSGDTSILAWNGKSGSFNSCFPGDISVFHQSSLSYIPPNQPGNQQVNMEATTARWRVFSLRSTSPRRLYNKLNELVAPSLSGTRIRLPCITFALGRPQCITPHHFRAKSVALGTVDIMSTEDISLLHPLYLVHPWIDFLLDRQPVSDGILADVIPEERGDAPFSLADIAPTPGHDDVIPLGAKKTRLERLFTPLKRLFGARSAMAAQDAISLQSPLPMSQRDMRTRAQRFVVRLKQPFDALLFTQIRLNASEYRRVAVDSVITVQVQDNTSLQELLDNVRLLDVL